MKPYANLILYSDIIPFEVIDHTAKTITIREMQARLCRDKFTPKFIPGGFCGHCINQGEQEWAFSSNPDAPTMKAYLRGDGQYWSKRGKHRLSDHPVKFNDYNF